MSEVRPRCPRCGGLVLLERSSGFWGCDRVFCVCGWSRWREVRVVIPAVPPQEVSARLSIALAAQRRREAAWRRLQRKV